MMKKKVLSVLLAGFLVVTMPAVGTAAADFTDGSEEFQQVELVSGEEDVFSAEVGNVSGDYQQDGIWYKYYKSTDSYYVTGYTKELTGEVIIPETVNGKKVTAVRKEAFRNCLRLSTIQLPETVTAIGSYAFERSDITQIKIPDSVVSIGKGAFKQCENLWKVELSNSLSSIGAEAFQCCIELEQIKIPNSVKKIGSKAFATTGLLKINLPSVVKSISKDAFENSPKVTLYVKPNSYAEKFAKKYGISYDNGSMKNAFITQNGITYQGVGNGYRVLRTEESLEGEIIIPEKINNRTVIAVGNDAFKYCEKITSVKLPDTVQTIGDSAFLKCGIKTMTIPDGVKTLESNVFAGSELEEITIPPSVTTIEGGAFRDTPLKKIVLPDTVKNIGEYVFAQCNELKEIRIPQGIRKIPNGFCQSCGALEVIDLPSSVETIGNFAFTFCFNVKEMHLPERLYSIGIQGLEYPETCTIYGKTNSLAESIAKTHNYTFISEGEGILGVPEIEAEVALGNCVRVKLKHRSPLAEEYEYVISKDRNFPETGKAVYYDYGNPNDKTSFYCLDKGTYYVFARSGESYVENDDLQWTYSDWSEPAKVSISYRLPETPVIKKVVTKGPTVTFTLEKAEGAKCYDFVLAKSAEELWVEHYFVPYEIKYSAKNRNEVTYTFKNVARGTYTALARSVSSQKDGKKLYGKWSKYDKEIIVRNIITE